MTHPIDPPITHLKKDDPIAKLVEGMDVRVMMQIIKTADRANEKAKVIDDSMEHEMRIVSALCTSYIYGTMYCMVELFKDLGHSEEAACRKAADYVQMASEMIVKSNTSGAIH